MNPLLDLLNSSKSFTTNEHIGDVVDGNDKPDGEFIKTLNQCYSSNSIVGQSKCIIPIQLHMECTIEVPNYDKYGTITNYIDVPMSGISSIGGDIDINNISTYSNCNYLCNNSSIKLEECTEPSILQSYVSNTDNHQAIDNKYISSLVNPDLNNTSMLVVDGLTVSTIECSIKHMNNISTVSEDEGEIRVTPSYVDYVDNCLEDNHIPVSPYTTLSCIDSSYVPDSLCNTYVDSTIDILDNSLIDEFDPILSSIKDSYINLYLAKTAGCSDESIEVSPYINKDAFSKIDGDTEDSELRTSYINMDIEGSPINKDALPAYIDADKIIKYINYLNSTDITKLVNLDNSSYQCMHSTEANKDIFNNLAKTLNDTDTQSELCNYTSPFDENFITNENKSIYFKCTKDADNINSDKLTCIHDYITDLDSIDENTEFSFDNLGVIHCYTKDSTDNSNGDRFSSIAEVLNDTDTQSELCNYTSPFDENFITNENKSIYFKCTKDADNVNRDRLVCINDYINKLCYINEYTEFKYLDANCSCIKWNTCESLYIDLANKLNDTDTKDEREKYVSPFNKEFNEDNRSYYFKQTIDSTDNKNSDRFSSIAEVLNNTDASSELCNYRSPFNEKFNEDNKSYYFKCTQGTDDMKNSCRLKCTYDYINKLCNINKDTEFTSLDASCCCSFNDGEAIELYKTPKLTRAFPIPDSFGYDGDNSFVSIVAGATANSLKNFLNSPFIVCDKFKSVADNFLFDSTQLFSNLTGMGLNIATSGIGVTISRFDPYLDMARPGATLMPHHWLPSRPYDGIGKRWKPIASGSRDESGLPFYLYSTMDSFGKGKGDKTDLGMSDTCMKYSGFKEHFYMGIDSNGCIEQGNFAGSFNTYTYTTKVPVGDGSESKYVELEGWEYKITMQSDIDPRVSGNESKGGYESKRFIGINTIREMTGMDIGTDFYWDLTFELIEDNRLYLPELPFSSYGRSYTSKDRESSKSNGNRDYIPIISFNLNGGSSSTTSIDTLLGPVSVFGGYNLPSSISLQLYDDTYHELDLWLREYLACIFQINSAGNNSTRNDDQSIFILPYKRQCMYINIYLYDMHWNEVRRRSYIVIPNFDLRLVGDSFKQFKQVDLSFNIVGSRGNIEGSQINVMDSDHFTGLNILD